MCASQSITNVLRRWKRQLECAVQVEQWLQQLQSLNGAHTQSKHFLHISSYNSVIWGKTNDGGSVHANFQNAKSSLSSHWIYWQIMNPDFCEVVLYPIALNKIILEMAIFPSFNGLLISELQNMLHQKNQFVRNFKAAMESIPQCSNEYNSIFMYIVIVKMDIILDSTKWTRVTNLNKKIYRLNNIIYIFC